MPFLKPESICPLCRKSAEFKFAIDHKNADGCFSLYECSSCLGQFWLPFKNPGAEWYGKGDAHNIKENGRPRQIHAYHNKFLALHPSLTGKLSLDLGCGTGEFMAELAIRGTLCYGTDFDKEAVEIAKNNFALKNIFSLDFDGFFAKTDNPPFDYITCFEVFEHTDNPLKILIEAKKLLKDNGTLAISTPGRERPLVNYSGWDYPYHHLSRWSEEAIKKMLALAGFKEVKIHYIGKYHQLYELFLEIIARALGFSRASGLKKISAGTGETAKIEKTVKRLLIKIIYRTGRFLGVILLPYIIAGLFYPISRIFYPRAGIMYIEAK